MRIHRLHSWDVTPKQAVVLQRELAGRIDSHSPLARCELIAGADISYNRRSSTMFAGVVVLRADDLSVVETQTAVQETKFPYVPGLLSFREAPPLLEVFAKVRSEPDLVMIDGQGLAHPRRMGIAAHLGLWLDRPTLGCAKSLLCGDYKKLKVGAGSVAELTHDGEIVGMAVRTQHRMRPIFVSVGHRIDLAGAIRVALLTCGKYRIPEPTRQAHQLVNAVRRAAAC